MHLADGLVNAPIAAAGYAVAGAACLAAARRAEHTLKERQVPLLGMTGAFIFAAQMLNFPVGPGVSGHFLGAVFAALLLGPAHAFLVMALVVAMQCLLFADGGLSALGVNAFNLGLVACFAGYGVFRAAAWVLPRSRWGFLAAAAVAAWSSVVAAALTCGAAMALSGRLPWIAVGPLAGIHAVIGLGEAGITVGALSIILGVRPDLVAAWKAPAPTPEDHPGPLGSNWAVFTAAALAVAVLSLCAPWASDAPDGLEKAAASKAALPAVETPPTWPPLAGYTLPGRGDSYWAVAFSALAGAVFVLTAGVLMARLWRRRRASALPHEPRP